MEPDTPMRQDGVQCGLVGRENIEGVKYSRYLGASLTRLSHALRFKAE